MPNGNQTDQARPILDPLPVDPSVKRAAWDAFHKSQTPEQFRAYFDTAQIPQDAKRALWDAKFGRPQADKSLWGRITEPLVSPETLLKHDPTYLPMERYKEEAIRKGGEPIRAGLWGGLAGAEKSSADILSSFTSPASLALMVASGGESAAAKMGLPRLASLLRIPQVAAALGFGVSGAKQALTPQQRGEDLPSSLERRLSGASAAVFGAAGAYAGGKDAIRAKLRKTMGLNEDLATKVSERAAKAQTIRAQAEQSEAAIRTQAEADVRAARSATAQNVGVVEQVLDDNLNAMREHTPSRISDIRAESERAIAESKGKLSALEQKKLRTGGQLLADTMQALDEEQAKASKPFYEIGEKIKAPVATVPDVKAAITQSFSDAGVNPAEIPPKIFQALGPEAGPQAISWFGKTMDVGKIIEKTAPENVARMRQAGILPPEGGNVSFNDLTRVREDLYSAARSAKDTAVKRALFDAYEKVTNTQEAAAKTAGLDREYRAAKQGYMNFKRGIGSDMIHDLLSANDAQEQAIAPKLAKFVNSSTAEALRTVLKGVGVDVGPLDQIVKDIASEKELQRTIPKEAKAREAEAEAHGKKMEAGFRRTAAGETRQAERAGAEAARTARAEAAAREQVVESEAKSKIAEAEGAGKIIPGKTATELTGFTNEQLVRQRLEHQIQGMREAGIRTPGALIQTVIGLYQLSYGSIFGFYHLGRSFTAMEIPELVRNRDFQDWVMRRSGVEPTNKLLVAKIRRGLDDLYPILRRYVKSGLASQQAATAAKQIK